MKDLCDVSDSPISCVALSLVLNSYALKCPYSFCCCVVAI